MPLPTRFEDRLLTQLRQVVADNPPPAATPVAVRSRAQRRRRLALSGAGLSAATAAIAIVASSGGVSPAFAVDREPDGSVSVHIASLRDADELERSLKQAGVPAEVTYSVEPAGEPCPRTASAEAGTQTSSAGGEGPSLQRAGTPASKGDVERAKVTSSVRVADDGVTFTIDPGQLGTDDKVFITTSDGTVSSIGISIGATAPSACEAPAPPPTP